MPGTTKELLGGWNSEGGSVRQKKWPSLYWRVVSIGSTARCFGDRSGSVHKIKMNII